MIAIRPVTRSRWKDLEALFEAKGGPKRKPLLKARVNKGTPVGLDEDSPSYRFMGFIPMFKEEGFKRIGKAGSRRQVMRLELR